MDQIARASLPPLSIRCMQPGDLDRVMAIAASLPSAPQWSSQAYLRALDPAASPTRIAFVAEAGEIVVGFVVVVVIQPDAEVESIAVALEMQSKGLGRLLLEAVITTLRAAQIQVLSLEIRASNAPAAALYRDIGFRQTGRRPGYYSNPAEDAILMECKLF